MSNLCKLDIVFIIAITIVLSFIIMKYYFKTKLVEGYSDEILQNISGYLVKGYFVQPGSISMYYGNVSNIPIGYALCDGNNGTPDLRDKFIVSTGNNYKLGSSGGSDNIVLSVDNLPAHSHTGTGNTNEGGINFGCSGEGDGRGNFKATRPDRKGQQDCGNTSHYHSFNFTTSNTGSNKSFDNRPSFYALAFIMKLPN